MFTQLRLNQPTINQHVQLLNLNRQVSKQKIYLVAVGWLFGTGITVFFQ